MNAFSLYIHVPFCTRRCSYCSFFHVQTISEFETAYVDALEDEIKHALAGPSRPLRTVFIGGGTPSVLSRPSLDRLFDALSPHLSPNVTEEITIELNPEDVTPELVTYLESQGVNRISLGIQSMNPVAQKVLKRCSPETNRDAIEIVGAVFDNVSFDVLLGVPGSSLDELKVTIDDLGNLRPAHFSVYCLEPGGDMANEVEKFFTAVDPERSADEYLYVCAYLREQGYRHYEVSNFALPGRESVHNHVYWGGSDFIGVGPGAHSFVGGARYHNKPSLSDYVKYRGAERAATRVNGTADPESADLERMMLALRTAEGMPLEWCACGPEEVQSLADNDLITVSGDRIRMTDAGFLLLNDVLLRVAAKGRIKPGGNVQAPG